MIVPVASLLFSTLLGNAYAIGDKLEAKAWKSASAFSSASDFPEASDSAVSSRPSTAIAFTGGGSRSYLASIGYIAGLNELGLMNKVRYISGISGGSWATLTYSYAQTTIDDSVLLGEVVPPNEITYEGLQQMDSHCVRSLTAVDFVGIGYDAFKAEIVDGMADAWAYATQHVYFEPVGIPSGTRFAYTQSQVDDIKSRNRALKNEKFLLPKNSQRPFPLVGTTLVGPTEGGGYAYDARNMSMIEITPMYVGQVRNQEISYQFSGILDSTEVREVGGFVETFAFGRYGDAPFSGIDSDKTSATLSVPAPESVMDIQFAGAASSYAPGAFVESFDTGDIASKFGLHMSYWSPVSKHPDSEDNLYCDGGSYMNIMLPSMLQRRVQKIVLFFNGNTPLQPASKWNPYTDEPLGEQVSDSLSSLFGVYENMTATWQLRSFDLSRNQMWATEEWAPLATQLQEAQATGNGIIVTKTLTTIENSWWGIPAGIKSQITFVYLGRLSKWEAQLSSEMKEMLVPAENADDLSVDIDEGPFKGFPHYLTAGGIINYERANALSDLTGWTILQNADLFRSIFA